MRRLAFALGNLSRRQPAVAEDRARSTRDTFDEAVRSQLDSWLASIRAQLEPGQLTPAPLRTMVSSATAPDLTAALQPLKTSGSAIDLAAREQVSRLIHALEHQLTIVPLS
ncbi:MAG TPA: hypothetical protein VJX23_17030 [Candidatus Binataceae bacterium]|nr:hypothetical protein [Candidatus Binataceae bacterium]